jgi:hypothetical protein
MRNCIILVLLLCIFGCTGSQKSKLFATYHVSETNKAVQSTYKTITLEQANALLESFATDGFEFHRKIIIAASNSKDIEIYLYSSCNEKCAYVVETYVPCSGLTRYFFNFSGINSNPMFTFFRSEEGFHEACVAQRKSWLHRILNI